MDRGLIDWLALALILATLGGVAYEFSRRTYRIATCVAIALGVAAVTGYGLSLAPQPANYLHALQTGGNELARQMFGGLVPGRLRGSLVPGLWGWLALLVLAGGALIAFDTLSTRRLQPVVQVGDVPVPASWAAVELGGASLADRRLLTEELKFRLPAVEVRAPASMPGGSAIQSLATVVSDSGVQGSKVTAAIMLAVHALEARPRLYQVNTLVEHCGPDGQLAQDGEYLQLTVDLRDARSGQSLAARVLRPCPPEEAAEMVAGFTARQVFRHDVTTPEWAAGSLDGEDLSAYLITREMRPAGRTFGDLAGCRQRQRARLEDAVCRSANSGLVQYELASIYDLDGQTLSALALHLDNRLHNPRFLRARYRLAMSLSMLAGDAVFSQWLAAAPGAGREPASLRDGIVSKLRWAGMLRDLPGSDLARLGLAVDAAGGRPASRAARERALARLLAAPDPGGEQEQQARRLLLLLARREFAACQRQQRMVSLLWRALRHRPDRAASLALLRSSPGWRHPRRRMWPLMVARAGADARLCLLEKSPEEAARELAAARHRVRRRLGLARVLDEGRAWQFGKVPWQAVYNAACLYALPGAGGRPGPREAGDAVRMLRLAISDPACELDRPSEWISADPDLRALRGHPAFDEFVREQASRDFSPAADNSMAGDWLRNLLPTLPAGKPEPPGPPGPPAAAAGPDGADVSRPAGRPGPGGRPAPGGWLRQLTRPRQPPP